MQITSLACANGEHRRKLLSTMPESDWMKRLSARSTVDESFIRADAPVAFTSTGALDYLGINIIDRVLGLYLPAGVLGGGQRVG